MLTRASLPRGGPRGAGWASVPSNAPTLAHCHGPSSRSHRCSSRPFSAVRMSTVCQSQQVEERQSFADLQTSAEGCGVQLAQVRNPSELLPLLVDIARLLGEAFWEGSSLGFTVQQEDEPKTPAQTQAPGLSNVGQWVYGWQLALQLLWYHVIYDSTLTMVLKKPGTGASKQGNSKVGNNSNTSETVVACSVAQLKVVGQELADACACTMRSPVVIISNVSVAEGSRGRGFGRLIMQAAEAAAWETFCMPKPAASTGQPGAGAGSKDGEGPPVQRMWAPEGSSLEDDSEADRTGEPAAKAPKQSQTWGTWWQTGPPELFALIVYKQNSIAKSLYASLGWNEARAWVDAAWVKDAEKGKLTSRPRRLLYVKTLPCSPEAVVQKCGGGAAPAMEASDSTAEASGDAAAAV